MKLKINKEKINNLGPEDALPVFYWFRNMILGKTKPDRFTRLIYYVNLVAWFLLMIWNFLSFVAISMSDVIKAEKGFSVNAIIRRHGRELGFTHDNGQTFLDAVTEYHFYNIFIWMFIFVGLVLLYRKNKVYTLIYLGGLAIHFVFMFWKIGIQYFIESVSFFDKILYALMIVSVITHSTVLAKNKNN